MDRVNFPGCCGAKIVYDPPVYSATQKEMRETISTYLASSKRNGCAFVCITTNNLQERANKLLPKMGFFSSAPMERVDQKGRFITLWWKPLKEEPKPAPVRKPRAKKVTEPVNPFVQADRSAK